MSNLQKQVIPANELKEVVDNLTRYYDELKEMYNTSFELDKTIELENKFLNSFTQLKDNGTVDVLIQCVNDLINLLRQAERNYKYKPTKAPFEAKCTLRDVWLARGFTEEYIDEYANGLLGKNKTLWMSD